MLFNSVDFLLFFPVTCLIYFAIPALRWRNLFLLGACWWFYASWEPAYLLLLTGSGALTYAAGRCAMRFPVRRRIFVASGICADLLLLFFFKYIDFAGDILGSLLSAAGLRLTIPHLGILLPVGISFYLFQAIGWLADIGSGKSSEKPPSPLRFALFMSFFPQLVAGPIERGSDLMPQFGVLHRPRYRNIMAGLKMMVAGYFLKLVIADRCAVYVDAVWNNLADHNGGSCLLASLLFSIQIYGDFAGYSLIAIGAARIMGFRLSENFRRPYLAASVTEFWQRWHITLSRWMRDYIYIPLGGNRKGKWRTKMNLLATMALSGLWHGADMTYLLWGGIYGAAMVSERTLGIGKAERFRAARILLTFLFVTFAWIFFRAPSMAQAGEFLGKIVGEPGLPFMALADFIAIGAGLTLWEMRRRFFSGRIGENAVIAGSIAYILLFGVLDGTQFLYFQF